VVEVQSEDTIVVATRTGTVHVALGSDAALRGEAGPVSTGQVEPGMHISGVITGSDDGHVVARTLTVRGTSSKPEHEHIVGIVVHKNRRDVTVRRHDGSEVTLTLDKGVDVPEVSDLVASVVRSDEDQARHRAKAVFTADRAISHLTQSIDRDVNTALRKLLEIRFSGVSNEHLRALHASLEEVRQEARVKIEAAFQEFLGRYSDLSVEMGTPPPHLELTGTVLKSTGSRLIVTSESGATVWEFNLVDNIPVRYRDGTPLAIAAVTPGSVVVVTAAPSLGDEALTAESIQLIDPDLPGEVQARLNQQSQRVVTGTIKLVDRAPPVDDFEVILIVIDESAADHAAGVTPDTTIVVKGQTGQPADLAEDQLVEVWIENDGITAETVLVREPWGSEIPLTGVIQAVDEPGRSISIRPASGAIQTFTVGASAVISLDGEPSQFSEIEPGDLVLNSSRCSAKSLVVTRLALAANVGGETSRSISSAEQIQYLLSGQVAAVEDGSIVLDGVRITTKDAASIVDQALIGKEVELIVETDTSGNPVIVGQQNPPAGP